jgi:DNA-binding YbaB/EbfC family protein
MNQDMMKQLAEMQERMAQAQQEIEARVAEATAGGGAVKVEMTGDYKVKSLKIDPDAVDPDDLSMLEDLVIAAMNEVIAQVQAFHADSMGAVTGGLDSLLPGLGGGDAGAGGGPPPGLNRAARRANKR